jgi:16S rRNA processing protein RimM
LHNPRSRLLYEQCPAVVLRFGDGRPEARFEVSRARASGRDHAIVELRGIDDRDAAAALRGAELCVERATLPEPAEGELYLIDLRGLRVERPDGQRVGTVRDAIEYPAAQVMAVEVPGGVLEIPLAAPYFVEARLAAGVVIVDAIEDLEIVKDG